MIDRRNLLAGLACAGSLGLAEALRPRRTLAFVPADAELGTLIPSDVAPWIAGEGGEIVIPRVEGSLASRLYSQQVARFYRDPAATLPSVMLLAAYGKAQSDVLQLHRPEVCYPAIGFEIVDRWFVDLDAGRGRKVPAVALTARTGARTEDIVYWTRVGLDLPRTTAEQRSGRLKAAFAGYIGDGLLVRASAVRNAQVPLHRTVIRFHETLLNNLADASRLAMIGPEPKSS
ncbi:exosortase-associated protein EpsI, V-type [Novosphingobium subterraneum]|uniref:Methanolan biosynthesis EpsI n=1 Tax=Novosphingobium subterraneum TaxID=48936 RepID=A0A0B8Z685_9SPHN|nr:exosortase-associated protein EpsI, V-type [Novosphingobium subterraneum]KHS41754.1 methanolan biosynthesis EpsI [Novosphingobium subterraneum]